MKWALYTTVLSGLAGGCGLTSTVADRRANESSNRRVENKGESAREFAERTNALFSQLSAQDMGNLLSSLDSTIAVVAGWRRVLLSVTKVEQSDGARPEEAALSRFLGLVEGRAQVRIPPVWEAGVLSVILYEAERADWADDLRFFAPRWLYERTSKSDPNTALARLRRDGDRWLVTQGSEKWWLPTHDDMEVLDYVSVDIHGNNAFVALYLWPPIAYKLYAVDRSSGEVAWSSDVWACCELMNYQGWGWHSVELRATDERLSVFGLSTDIAYLEVFDRNTGENLWRFNTYLGASVN